MVSVRIPTVVVGAGANGLGVARSLARAQVPVWLLDTDAQRPEMHTRAACPLQISAMHGEALVEELLRVADTRFSGLRPVLLLTQEESVKTVSRHRDRLSVAYRISLPPRGILDALLHKNGFQHLAERFDAPIPKLVHVGTPDDLPALGTLRYPVVVKPGERDAAYGQQFKKAYQVASVDEATDLVRRILAVMPDVVAQEWIEGPDSAIYFCLQCVDRQGQTVASFTGRKVRSWPPHVGGTASCIAAPEAHAELDAMTTRFFYDVGVIGMASMEYKRDTRSGAFRMVEPTVGRTDYQEEVATLNGTNLPYAAYCAELGLSFPAPATTKRAVGWRVRSEDIQSAAAQGQQHDGGWPRGSRVVDAIWRWDDPRPAWVQGMRRVRDAMYRHATRRQPGSQAARGKP